MPLLLLREVAQSIPAANLLDSPTKTGLIPVSLLATCSVLSTFALLLWLTYRLIFKHEYQAFVGYNQYVILIYNLLLADLQQSLSFFISIHWLRLGQIDSPSRTCFAQGWLIQIGDVASGFFVLAIALHTWFAVVMSRKISYNTFTMAILGIWAFALLVTILGPAVHGPRYFVRAGAWVSSPVAMIARSPLITVKQKCWADGKYDIDRLWLHYVWIFIIEFGTIMIYTHVFLHLRKRLRSIRSVSNNHSNTESTSKLSQAARYMVLYPIIYIVLTLPLAAGRMAAMSGTDLPEIYYCIAGSLMTSCGWLDSLLYTLTRRVFIKPETRDDPRSSTRPSTAFATQSKMSKRGWIGLKSTRNLHQEPAPNVISDSQWHLSTFASIDVKGPQESDTNSDDLILEMAHHRGRNTPGLDERSKLNAKVSHTETIIDRGEEDAPVIANAIITETTIQVVSESRKEADGPT
jgi:hypothetical protein